jgi:hypothetical protein
MKAIKLRSSLLITMSLSLNAFGEGAVRVFTCEVKQLCNAEGACAGNNEAVTLRMEPLSRNSEGAGKYKLSYHDTQAEMQAQSDAGPFLWTIGSERHALITSSNTDFLWHRLMLDPAPHTEVRFMRCSVR